jgi:hypothetical protein
MRGIPALICLAYLAFPADAIAQCRQALALGLDVSGSVDKEDFRLQRNGLVAALEHPDVRDALLSTPAIPVRLAVYEWSGPTYQRIIVEWTPITGPDAIARITDRLRSDPRRGVPPATALGTAMAFGATLLDQQPQCWKHTLDISGDGKHNAGPHPRDVQAVLAASGLTVNALVIGADAPADGDRRQVQIGELASYFRAWILTGQDAFLETALGFEDYEAAMIRKLTRELQAVVVSELPPR